MIKLMKAENKIRVVGNAETAGKATENCNRIQKFLHVLLKFVSCVLLLVLNCVVCDCCWLAVCIVVVVLCVLLSYVYFLYIFFLL